MVHLVIAWCACPSQRVKLYQYGCFIDIPASISNISFELIDSIRNRYSHSL